MATSTSTSRLPSPPARARRRGLPFRDGLRGGQDHPQPGQRRLLSGRSRPPRRGQSHRRQKYARLLAGKTLTSSADSILLVPAEGETTGLHIVNPVSTTGLSDADIVSAFSIAPVLFTTIDIAGKEIADVVVADLFDQTGAVLGEKRDDFAVSTMDASGNAQVFVVHLNAAGAYESIEIPSASVPTGVTLEKRIQIGVWNFGNNNGNKEQGVRGFNGLF